MSTAHLLPSSGVPIFQNANCVYVGSIVDALHKEDPFLSCTTADRPFAPKTTSTTKSMAETALGRCEPPPAGGAYC